MMLKLIVGNVFGDFLLTCDLFVKANFLTNSATGNSSSLHHQRIRESVVFTYLSVQSSQANPNC